MKLDILAIAAHPDDVELSCGGTVAKQVALGYKVGILDLTKGELGTRGTEQIRAKEAQTAGKILGISIRENMGLADGFFKNDSESQLKVIEIIRKYQPNVILANAWEDRHPDHGRAAILVEEACFLSGLKNIATKIEGIEQEVWRPTAVYHYIQAYNTKPDIVVDISDYIENKMEAIKAFKSQFYDPASTEPKTLISDFGFMDSIKGRAADLGISIGVKYAEGFTSKRMIAVNNLSQLI